MTDQIFLLTMRSGPTPGMTYQLEKTETSIGREATNDVSIADAEVSRRHARIIKQDESFLIEDLGSTNGTFVNNARVSAPQPLKPGDFIVLGESISLFFDSFPINLEEKPAEVPTFEPEITPEPEPEVSEPAFQVYETPAIAPIEEPVPMSEEEIIAQAQAAIPVEVTLEDAEKNSRKKLSSCLIVILLILLVVCIIPTVIMIFMPTSWWCALFSFFSYFPAGCPIP